MINQYGIIEPLDADDVCDVIEILRNGFSFSAYNPREDYLNVAFTIKSKEDADKLNKVLFNRKEVLKLE